MEKMTSETPERSIIRADSKTGEIENCVVPGDQPPLKYRDLAFFEFQ